LKTYFDMDLKKLDYALLFIQERWENKSGIIGVYLGLIIIIYNFFDIIKNFALTFLPIPIFYLVLFLFLMIPFVIWYISTNRFILNNNSQLKIAILINTDEEGINIRIKRIVQNVIHDIEEKFEKRDLKIILLPINYLTKKKEIMNFLDSRQYGLDNIVWLKLASGNFDSVELMKIEKITYIGFFRKNITERQIFFDKINLVPDINLTNFHKDWKCETSNEGNDKKKLKENLEETILHYCGIYAIYIGNHELALSFIKSIFKPQLTILKGNAEEQNKVKLKAKNVVAGRLANILINLYSSISFNKLKLNQQKEGISLLIECESLIKNHKYSYSHYLTMARMCYEIGNINDAKHFTLKAHALKPDSLEVSINNGWFAIIENNPKQLVFYYKKVYNRIKKGCNLNWVELIAFFDKYRDSYIKSTILIDFAEGFIYKLILDRDEGEKIISEIIKKINGNEFYKDLNVYCEELCINGKANNKIVKGDKRKVRKKWKYKKKIV
jgi:hypothetical protein